MASPSWLVVASREFSERVRTIWFIVVTLLGPLAMVGLIVVPVYLSKKSSQDEVKVQVIDHTGTGLASKLSKSATGLAWKFEDVTAARPTLEQLRDRIRAEEIDGFLTIPADAASGGEVVYRGVNGSSQVAKAQLQGLLDYTIRYDKLIETLSPEVVLKLLERTDLEMLQDMGEADAQSGSASFIIGYAVMFILYMAILLYAVNVLRSVIQEKTSRVVEIMVSAVKPRALMLGKILGVGSVGLFQLSIWAVVAALLIRFRDPIIGLFGGPPGLIDVPSISPLAIGVVLIYFIVGYFFYASLYAAIGAMVNSEQEAQQAQTPVVLLLIVPVVCVQLVADNPRGDIAELLTLIPFSSPILMPMRYLLGGATLADVALSLAILVAATAGVVWLAARIYRVGILMYGKRPSLRELARWIKYG